MFIWANEEGICKYSERNFVIISLPIMGIIGVTTTGIARIVRAARGLK